MILIPSCSSEIIGTDIMQLARKASAMYSVDVIPVLADSRFLSSKFGGIYGLMDSLICRMRPREIEKGTVNLIARGFFGSARDIPRQVMDDMFSMFGLRVRTRFLDFCSLEDIEGFCGSEYDIQMADTMLDDRICERISEVTGRRRALLLEQPTGLCECIEWAETLANYVGTPRTELQRIVQTLRSGFDAIIEEFKPVFSGKSVVVFCIRHRDLTWQIETMKALGMDILKVMYLDSTIDDNTEPPAPIPGVETVTGAKVCDLREFSSKNKIDVVVTNDAYRVGRTGLCWTALDSRYPGLYGVRFWLQTMRDCMLIGKGTWEEGL